MVRFDPSEWEWAKVLVERHHRPNRSKIQPMAQFYQPDLGANPDDPFARDTEGKLVRRAIAKLD